MTNTFALKKGILAIFSALFFICTNSFAQNFEQDEMINISVYENEQQDVIVEDNNQ